ncbi:diacylglycerol kinase family protein [Parafannyhessea umbonata]|jgi:diacylglycerol kinase|uniref:diacylglycerol kinase family protein n=1 Tax=Parafannyhessea TaxID=2847312 RepID=UPI001568A2CC|nr:diacylglycerol kinase family protein [Parafannyhessea umbonata]MCI6681785.1 diacylglycerol kinase family protein [Parafannyhessea umbonata]MCI7218607.1 diacylglycerol kinase family protein [Parafannyhessea umbonata]MDD6358474.1 diacylglycerol kinase family protein [Parafannyhessea umbonata]MDD6566003.1 diacylglycerol kinase family protein [Parafannyhessea umbonata]MDD6602485.1 diacylglycerol kinase family protein [Parafannyhessea umbonata]
MIPGRSPSHPSFRRSFLFALQGFRTALRQERNIKVMLAGGAFAVAMGLILRIDAVSWAVVLVCCGMVIAAELLNTAIETVVDLVSPEFHPLAGQAKDIAAAASWVLSLTAAVVGVIVYANALIRLLVG